MSDIPPLGACYPVLVTDVKDGDTVDVTVLARCTLRLQGVRAPSLEEDGGQAAKDALEKMIAAGSDYRAFVPYTLPLHGQTVGVLYSGDGTNIGEVMVESGLAREEVEP